MKTPVAFIIFNRPETTARVFAQIAEARPAKLLIVGDGPRPDRPDDAEKCAATRAVVEKVNWDCEVLTNFSEVNLGCKPRVSSGLDWVFSRVEEAIILEDDCLPQPSFFPFCQELLERYRDEKRLTAISGNNFQQGRVRTPFSYYFSRYLHIWGWASWRRAWQDYDVEMKQWAALRQTSWLKDLLGDDMAVRYWTRIFDMVAAGEIQTWDYQWLFASWLNNGLSVAPEVNLVSNIGFGAESTHTEIIDQAMANLPTKQIAFPLSHPATVAPHSEADEFEAKHLFKYQPPSLYDRARRKLSVVVPGMGT